MTDRKAKKRARGLPTVSRVIQPPPATIWLLDFMRDGQSRRTLRVGKLPGLDKKARVAFDWMLDLLFRKDVCAVHNLPPRANVQPLFPTDQGTEVIRPGRIGLSCDWESGSYR